MGSIESDHYFRSSFLFQEYIVEMWLAAEHSRLHWIHDHQANLHADLYTSVVDALHEGLHPSTIGRKVILCSSYTCSPCFMQKNLQHALTLLRVLGSSDLFITFTANPTWPEITNNLLPGQNTSDHISKTRQRLQVLISAYKCCNCCKPGNPRVQITSACSFLPIYNFEAWIIIFSLNCNCICELQWITMDYVNYN